MMISIPLDSKQISNNMTPPSPQPSSLAPPQILPSAASTSLHNGSALPRQAPLLLQTPTTIPSAPSSFLPSQPKSRVSTTYIKEPSQTPRSLKSAHKKAASLCHLANHAKLKTSAIQALESQASRQAFEFNSQLSQMRKFNRESFKKQEFKKAMEGEPIPARGQNGFISAVYNPGVMFVNYMNGLTYH